MKETVRESSFGQNVTKFTWQFCKLNDTIYIIFMILYEENDFQVKIIKLIGECDLALSMKLLSGKFH